MELSLTGRFFLNTRSRAQSGELGVLLRERGADVLDFPALELRTIPCAERVPRELRWICSEGWLVFTSANGVRSFFELLDYSREKRGVADASGGGIGSGVELALGEVKIAVIGKKTESCLADYGAKAKLVAAESNSERLAGELLLACGRDGKRRVLLFRASNASAVLPYLLRSGGCEVRDIAIYESVLPKPSEKECSEFSLALSDRGKALDMAIATSSQAVENLLVLCDGCSSTATFDAVSHLLAIPLAAIGRKTERTARELGFSVPVVAEEASTESLVESIENYWSERVTISQSDS